MEAELQERAARYDAMAKMHAIVTFDERRAFDTASVRHLNNFVKACIIDTACSVMARSCKDGIRVVDVACGRGQDQSKWMYGCRNAHTHVAAYCGMDLSHADIETARILARRYISPSTSQVHFQTGDMGICHWDVPDLSADVVTCQLALHYFCDEEDHLQHFFREAARVLTPRGLLLVSFTDGRSVVRRARESGGRHTARYYTLDVPPSSYAIRLPSPFSNRYTFTMPGSVEEIPEYLCHEGAACRIAGAYGLLWGNSMYFDELGVMFNKMPYFQQVSEKMGGNGIGDPDALDAANLYRHVVFSKNRDVLSRFSASMKGHHHPVLPRTPETGLRPSPCS